MPPIIYLGLYTDKKQSLWNNTFQSVLHNIDTPKPQTLQYFIDETQFGTYVLQGAHKCKLNKSPIVFHCKRRSPFMKACNSCSLMPRLN